VLKVVISAEGPALVLNAQPTSIAELGVDLAHPSVARVYDFLLGGSANWAIDRAFGMRLLRQFPEFRNIALGNRGFVDRVVRHLARRGVRQFVDIGSGALSDANTHQVVDQIAPDSRVVYVDTDPVAVAHAEVLLDEFGDPDRHAVIDMDLCQPDRLWRELRATGVIDLEKPVAVLMFSVLHLLKPEPGNDICTRSVARYRELLPVGSYLGVSHITDEGIPAELADKLVELKRLCDDCCTSEIFCRPRSAIDAFLGDFEPVDPGMVWTPQWHPEDTGVARPVRFSAPNEAVIWGGVGRKAR
jgi:hypothetical protein